MSGLIHLAGAMVLSLLPGSKTVPATEPYLQFDCCQIDEVGTGGGDGFVLFPGEHEKPGAPAKSEVKNTPEILPVVAHQPFEPTLVLPGENLIPSENPPLPAMVNNKTGHTPTSGGNPSPGDGFGSGNGHGGIQDKGTTSFFQIPAQGMKIVYVIDRSSSMGKHGALKLAIEQLLVSLQSLPELAEFQVIVYNSLAHPLMENHPGWLQATLENKKLAAQALFQLEATRGTTHKLALPMALGLKPDTVFFLTDADDLEMSYLNEITRLNKGRAAIHVIELNITNIYRQDTPLQIFARQNKGTYRAIDLSYDF